MGTLITSPEMWYSLGNPHLMDSRHRLFLAGGISDCPDWQKPVGDRIIAETGSNTVIINPRRIAWNMDGNDLDSIAQIEWEFDSLQNSTDVIFWFPKETLCPITLLELGAHLWKHDVNLFIGTHPLYKRALDVTIQTRLVRGEAFPIYHDLDEMVDAYVASNLEDHNV